MRGVAKAGPEIRPIHRSFSFRTIEQALTPDFKLHIIIIVIGYHEPGVQPLYPDFDIGIVIENGGYIQLPDIGAVEGAN